MMNNCLTSCLAPSDPYRVPEEALIVAAKNRFDDKGHKLDLLIDETIQQIAAEQKLLSPNKGAFNHSTSDHCVAMSLHFIERYRKGLGLTAAGHAFATGVDVACAKTTGIYEAFFDANVGSKAQKKLVNHEFLYQIKNATAKTLNLQFSEGVNFRGPVERFLPDMESKLPAGEYLIAFPRHSMAFVKDEQGKMTVFDPDHGTIDLSCPQGKKWFSNLLYNTEVHLTETLMFYKVADYTLGDIKPFRLFQTELTPQPVFKIEKGNDRWGTAVFAWRGETFRLPMDQQTGTVYNHNSKRVIRIKCALLVPRTLLDAAIRTIYHLAMTIFKVCSLPVVAATKGKRAFKKASKELLKSALDILRAPTYGVIGMGVAFYGMFKPFDGRRLYGTLERRLNRQELAVSFSKKHYIAPCFTPWNLGGEGDMAETVEKLKITVLRYKHFRGNALADMCCGWRKNLCRVAK